MPAAPTRRAAPAALLFLLLSLLPGPSRAAGPAPPGGPRAPEPVRFVPYENESDVVGIGPDLAVENRLDRVTLAGSVDLTLDRPGLEKAEALRALLERVCRALRDHGPLPERIAAVPAGNVDNPFE